MNTAYLIIFFILGLHMGSFYTVIGLRLPKHQDFIKTRFPDSKADLYAAFIEKCIGITNRQGICSMVTMNSWMFLSSFESLRNNVLRNATIETINHLGMEAFDGIIGKVVQTVAFTINCTHINDYKGIAVRLVDFYDSKRWLKETEFFNPDHRNILGAPIAYWVSQNFLKAFERGMPYKEFGKPRVGLQTSNNELFLRLWYECNARQIELSCTQASDSQNSTKKWYPHNKGGAYRKWYGNHEYVIIYKNNGEKLRATEGAAVIPDDIVQPKNTYFKYAVSEEKKFNTSRDIKKTFDEEHENAFKFKTSREVWGSIYNTRRDLKKTFDEEHGNAFKFNTLLLPARFEGLDSHNTERDVRYTFDEEHDNAFKFNTSVTNTISLDKIKDADKYIKKKTERNVLMNLWTMIGDIRFDGIKFNTKLIITNTIDVEIFFNSMRRCIINIEKMFNTKKEVKQIGDANHPSQVNNTIRDVRTTYYLKFNTNLMALIIQNNNTKRNVVLTVTKTYETRRHVKVYTRPYIVFVTNTNINIEQPKDYEYINELLKN